MRILRVISTMDPKSGGPCEGIRSSIPAMAKIQVSNEVVCFDSPSSYFVNNQGFLIHALGCSKGPYAYCEGLKEWLKKNLQNYDIVIIHGLWLYNSYGTWRVWWNMKKAGQKVPRLFVMPHGMLDPYFQKAKGRKFKAIRNFIFWKLIEKNVIHGADGLLFTCEEEMLLARENFKPYLPEREINIGYGIKAPPAQRENFRTKFLEKVPGLNGEPYWLFLGRIHPKKGLDMLLEVYLDLRKKYRNMPHLVIAGPGLESNFGKSIQNLASDPQIHLPGMLEGERKWGAFYGCETFILPSHQENFGIAVVEAMACAKPVLISNKVNIWREIEGGKGGLVFKDTIEDLYITLEHFLKLQTGNKTSLGQNALHLFKKYFTVEQAAIKMMGSLQDV